MPIGFDRSVLRRRNPDEAALDRFCDGQNFGLFLRRQAQRLRLPITG
jgi:hypothetical protein